MKKSIILSLVLLLSLTSVLAQVEKSTEVPYFVEAQLYADTCGVDYDNDGELCDANEHVLSCPEDCNFPTFDELICANDCVWMEEWFLKVVFGGLILVTIYLVYTDMKLPRRRRTLFA